MGEIMNEIDKEILADIRQEVDDYLEANGLRASEQDITRACYQTLEAMKSSQSGKYRILITKNEKQGTYLEIDNHE